jgi:hypothetical protein
MMEQVKFLKNFIDKHTSYVIRTKPLEAKVMSSVEESSSVKSKLVPSLDLTVELSPQTPNTKGKNDSTFGVRNRI